MTWDYADMITNPVYGRSRYAPVFFSKNRWMLSM
jgi:hypothetical protein